MFELVNYEIHKQDNKFIIQIFMSNPTNESHDVKIVFKDSIFQQCTKVRTMNFSPKMTHWVSWDLTQNNAIDETHGIQMRALWGADLTILVKDEVVNEFKLKYVLTDLELRRGLDRFSPFNKKKFWIVGDSHSGYYTNTSTENLTTSNYDIIPSGMLALTLNNFLRGDWKKWFDTLPIFDNDIVSFDIGEIDIRCGLFETSNKKGIELYSLTDNLLTRYFQFLLDFRSNYKNDIVVLVPNRPIKDGCLTGNADYFKLTLTNASQRLELWNYFTSKLKSFCDDNSIKCWDIKQMYTDKDGTLFNDVLYYNDIHIKVKEPMLFDLKHKIENNF